MTLRARLAPLLLALAACSSAPFPPDPRPPSNIVSAAQSTCECRPADTYESSCACGTGDREERIAITCTRHRDSQSGAVCLDTCPPCQDVCLGGPRELGCAVRQAP